MAYKKKGRRSASGSNAIDGRLASLVAEHVDSLVAALSQAVRKQVADELQRAIGATVGGGGSIRAPRMVGRPKRRHIRPCIAPGCSNPSKGPRFHYLCEKHRGAAKRDYEAWRKGGSGKKSEASAG